MADHRSANQQELAVALTYPVADLVEQLDDAESLHELLASLDSELPAATSFDMPGYHQAHDVARLRKR